MRKLRVTAAVILCVVGALTATASRAEEDSPKETARELLAPAPGERPREAWQASVEGEWLPRSDSPDAGGRVGMSEATMKLGHTYTVTPRLSLTPEVTYALLHLTAPDTARLPEELHAVSVGLRGDYRVSSKLSFGALVVPGLAGDFKRIGGDDLRVRIGFTGRYKTSDHFTLLAGVIYREGYESLPVFPILGVVYRPNERWTISIVAPRPGVTYAPGKELRVHVGGEFFSGEYQLHDPALGAQVIRYRDFRVLGGADFTIIAPLKGELAAGYAFARKFRFYDVFDPTRPDIRVAAAPFARAGLKMEW